MKSKLSTTVATLTGAILFTVFGLVFAGAGFAITISQFHKAGWKIVLFGLPFEVIGLGLVAVALASIPIGRRTARRQAEHPDEPWLWNDDWASGAIPDHATGGAIGAWIVAIFASGITGATVWAMFAQKRRHDAKELLILLFVILSLGLVVNAIRATRRVMRFGKSMLHLTTLPGQIGGRLSGTIHVDGALDAAGPIQLRLTCTRITRNGEDTTRSLQWEDEQELPQLRSISSGSEIQVDFAIPSDQPPTCPSTAKRHSVEWQLHATAITAGVKYKSRFTVPVFEVSGIGHSSPTPPARSPVQYRPQNEPQKEPLNHPGIVVSRLADGGCKIDFAAGRNWGSAIVLTLFAAALVLLAIFLPRTNPPLLAEGAVCLMAFIFASLAIGAWFSSATVVARPHTLHIDRGVPLLRRRVDIPAESIRDITERVNGQSGNSVYYTLEAVTDKDKVTIVTNVRDKRVALWLAGEMKQSLRRATPPVPVGM